MVVPRFLPEADTPAHWVFLPARSFTFQRRQQLVLVHPHSSDWGRYTLLHTYPRAASSHFYSIRANLTDASHRGRILYFENQFSVTKLFQIFWYLGGIFNFEQSEPIGKWYCKHIFANLAVETATYVLANKAFNAYLTNRVAVDPSRNPVNQCDHVRDLTVKNNLFRQQR